MKAGKAKKEAEAMVRNCKEKCSRKEAILEKKMAEADSKIVSARKMEQEVGLLIEEGVRLRTSSLKEQLDRKANKCKKDANRKFNRMRERYMTLFILSCLYGIIVTLFTAMRSEILCQDAELFFRTIGKGAVFFVTGVHRIAGFLAGVGENIPYPILSMLLFGIVYLLITVIIYGGLILLISYPLKRYLLFFREKQADEFTLFMFLLCAAVPVYFGNWIKWFVPINLIILMIVLVLLYLIFRGVMEAE